MYKIKLAKPSELDALLDREAYLAYVREQGWCATHRTEEIFVCELTLF